MKFSLQERIYYIADGIDSTVQSVSVIGNLSASEARRYVLGGKGKNMEGEFEYWQGIIKKYKDAPPMGRAEWEEVYRVCGGNMHLLSHCVRTAANEGSWDEGESGNHIFNYTNIYSILGISNSSIIQTICLSHGGAG